MGPGFVQSAVYINSAERDLSICEQVNGNASTFPSKMHHITITIIILPSTLYHPVFTLQLSPIPINIMKLYFLSLDTEISSHLH